MPYHNSRDPHFRSPVGALPCGTTLRLRFSTPFRTSATPVLRLWADEEVRLPMKLLGVWEGKHLYEKTIETPATPTLLWYRFEWEDASGNLQIYGNALDKLGGIGAMHHQESFQVSVYDPAFSPPTWLREGVMYQIMVDRFCKEDPTGQLFYARDDIQRHQDWYERPTLVLDADGDNQALDFFGGTLRGIESKLPYLKDLGITVLYLNPIFRARSNHKYDVGDFLQVDPMFGALEDFQRLCATAWAQGIRVLLDGVFSHVGTDSRYFNKYGTYDSVGAYQSQASPYYPWFTFREFPEDYQNWWGFRTLPEINEMEPSFLDFSLEGQDAVVPYWIRQGASGWRLDVADELPMEYLRRLRKAARGPREDAVLLGEVWEDASNKVSYGEQRSYVLGDTLDSVMNYPLRDAMLRWMLHQEDARTFIRKMDSLRENYPTAFFFATMNLIGSHDRARVLNSLAEQSGESMTREERASIQLTDAELSLAKRRLSCLLRLQLALPGIPCIYYGDEAGMTGADDPFCRGTYPWGREDQEVLSLHTRLLHLRRTHRVLHHGELSLHSPAPDVLMVRRFCPEGKNAFGEAQPDAPALVLLNRSCEDALVRVPSELMECLPLTDETGAEHSARDGAYSLSIPAQSGMFFFGTVREENT